MVLTSTKIMYLHVSWTKTGKKNLVERYGTLTPDLVKLREVFLEHDIGRVVMESIETSMPEDDFS